MLERFGANAGEGGSIESFGVLGAGGEREYENDKG
jgi:hypothetical protein